jgi:hypothetical protein
MDMRREEKNCAEEGFSLPEKATIPRDRPCRKQGAEKESVPVSRQVNGGRLPAEEQEQKKAEPHGPASFSSLSKVPVTSSCRSRS